MHFRIFLFLVTIVSLFGPVMAISADSVQGTLTINGKAIDLKHIHARYEEDPNNKGEQLLILTLTDIEISDPTKNKLQLREQAKAGKLNLVQLDITFEKKISGTMILSSALKTGFLFRGGTGGEPQEITIGPDVAKGILEKHAEDSDHKWAVKADFEVNLPEKK